MFQPPNLAHNVAIINTILAAFTELEAIDVANLMWSKKAFLQHFKEGGNILDFNPTDYPSFFPERTPNIQSFWNGYLEKVEEIATISDLKKENDEFRYKIHHLQEELATLKK